MNILHPITQRDGARLLSVQILPFSQPIESEQNAESRSICRKSVGPEESAPNSMEQSTRFIAYLLPLSLSFLLGAFPFTLSQAAHKVIFCFPWSWILDDGARFLFCVSLQTSNDFRYLLFILPGKSPLAMGCEKTEVEMPSNPVEFIWDVDCVSCGRCMNHESDNAFISHSLPVCLIN